MNDLPEFKPNTSSTDVEVDRWINRTITCSFTKENFNDTSTHSIIIIGKSYEDCYLSVAVSHCITIRK